MSNSTQKVKGVSFNTTNALDKEILAFAESKGNFADYVKKLIFLDMRLDQMAKAQQ